MTGFVSVFGNSHMATVRRAAMEAAEKQVKFFPIKNEPGFTVKDHILSSEFTGADACFFAFAGNMHNVLGVVNHPVPFDFDLDAECSAGYEARIGTLAKDREIIPFQQMKQAMQARIAQNLTSRLKAMAAAAKVPCFVLQAPPPLGSEDHMRAHPSKFKQEMDARGISPPNIRLKLWLLQSRCIQETASECGATVVPVPPDSVREDGLLREDYSSEKDPTHGNTRYGAAVLAQIMALRPVN